MFDDLIDPDPPRPGHATHAPVSQRARRLSRRRGQVVERVGAPGMHLSRAKLKEQSVSILHARRLQQRSLEAPGRHVGSSAGRRPLRRTPQLLHYPALTSWLRGEQVRHQGVPTLALGHQQSHSLSVCRRNFRRAQVRDDR